VTASPRHDTVEYHGKSRAPSRGARLIIRSTLAKRTSGGAILPPSDGQDDHVAVMPVVQSFVQPT
jgi:hypothetical protein